MRKMFGCLTALLLAIGLLSVVGCQNNTAWPPTDAETTLTSTTDETEWMKQLYRKAKKLHDSAPDVYRDIGNLQRETQEILIVAGQYYQSYVDSDGDLRYVFVRKAEYPLAAEWDWLPIGTKDEYYIEILGQIGEGYR